jgi:hypothetical protein
MIHRDTFYINHKSNCKCFICKKDREKEKTKQREGKKNVSR